MNTLSLVVLFAVVAASSASVIGLAAPLAVGSVVKGPSSAATIVGPDGSSISAAADSGAVAAAPTHGGIISAAVAPGYVAHAPAVVHAAPAVVAAPVVTAPVVAPAIIGHGGAVISGPSGSIVTNNGLGLGLGLGHGIIGAAPLLGHSIVAPGLGLAHW